MSKFMSRGRFVGNDDQTSWVDCATIDSVSITAQSEYNVRHDEVPGYEISVSTGTQEVSIKSVETMEIARVAVLWLLDFITQTKNVSVQQGQGGGHQNVGLSLNLNPPKVK